MPRIKWCLCKRKQHRSCGELLQEHHQLQCGEAEGHLQRPGHLGSQVLTAQFTLYVLLPFLTSCGIEAFNLEGTNCDTLTDTSTTGSVIEGVQSTDYDYAISSSSWMANGHMHIHLSRNPVYLHE